MTRIMVNNFDLHACDDVDFIIFIYISNELKYLKNRNEINIVSFVF